MHGPRSFETRFLRSAPQDEVGCRYAALVFLSCAVDASTFAASIGQRASDRRPDLVLDPQDRRRIENDRRSRSLFPAWHQASEVDFTVREIAIAAAVSAIERRTDAGDLIERFDQLCGHQTADQLIALGVDIRRDMMCDRAGIVTEPDAAIERHRAEPDRPSLLAFIQCQPEADM